MKITCNAIFIAGGGCGMGRSLAEASTDSAIRSSSPDIRRAHSTKNKSEPGNGVD